MEHIDGVEESQVSHLLTVYYLVSGHSYPHQQGHAELWYDRDDPCAAHISFLSGAGSTYEEPVTWEFARNLMGLGLQGLSGHGDVMFWPYQNGKPGWNGVVQIVMSLKSPDGDCLVLIPKDDVISFLRETYRLVPPRKERKIVRKALSRYLSEVLEWE